MPAFDLVHFFSLLPPNWAVFFMGMTPIAELQVAIPVGLGVYRMNPWDVYLWATLGNLVPVILLGLYLGPVSEFLRKHFVIFDKFFTWLFAHTRNKMTQKYLIYGEWALFFFIAIPTPLSGAWSSSAAAFIFGVPVRRALALIIVGELIAGLIILGISQGVFTFFFH